MKLGKFEIFVYNNLSIPPWPSIYKDARYTDLDFLWWTFRRWK